MLRSKPCQHKLSLGLHTTSAPKGPCREYGDQVPCNSKGWGRHRLDPCQDSIQVCRPPNPPFSRSTVGRDLHKILFYCNPRPSWMASSPHPQNDRRASCNPMASRLEQWDLGQGCNWLYTLPNQHLFCNIANHHHYSIWCHCNSHLDLSTPLMLASVSGCSLTTGQSPVICFAAD